MGWIVLFLLVTSYYFLTRYSSPFLCGLSLCPKRVIPNASDVMESPKIDILPRNARIFRKRIGHDHQTQLPIRTNHVGPLDWTHAGACLHYK